MKITVIGSGFVGVVTAGIFAKFGNQVQALDVDPEKIKLLQRGKIPFFEPNLEELVKETQKSGRLKFTLSYSQAIPDSEVIFICVGTPAAPDKKADLQYVFQAAKSMAPYLSEKSIVIIKSTVPPGAGRQIKKVISQQTKVKFFTALVPEFLKEGSAIHDACNPARVIIGADHQFVIGKLLDLHKPLGGKKIVVKPESAMLVKYASNTYLAQRIVFINEIANLCEKVNADIDEVISGLGADERIGSHYWYPGPGYGGSCFPKDVKELAALARSLGEVDGLFEKIDELNESRVKRLLLKYEKQVKGFKGKKVAVLGLSFKPNTDDLREAPSLKFIPALIKMGAQITAYDPKAIEAAKKISSAKINYCQDVYQAAEGADVVLLLVEWDEFKQLNLKKLREKMKGRIFIDTRNLYEKDKLKRHGFKYIGIGK